MEAIDEAPPVRILFVGEGDYSFFRALCIQLWPSRAARHRAVSQLLQTIYKKEDMIPLKHLYRSNSLDSCTSMDSDVAVSRALAAENGTSPAVDYLGISPAVARGPLQLFGTSFDSERDLFAKYGNFKDIQRRINVFKPMAQMSHEVNAWDLKRSFGSTSFDIIAWNHPHLGREDFRLHEFLMAHFFHEAKKMLKPGADSRVILTLVDGQAERWNLVEQAKKQKFFWLKRTCICVNTLVAHAIHENTAFILQLVSCTSFKPRDFPGYETKRNKGGRSFQNSHTQKHVGNSMPSFRYVFKPVEDSTDVSNIKNIKLEMNALSKKVDDSPANAMDNAGNNRKSEVESFKCHSCDKNFTSKQGLFTHTRQVHELKKYASRPPSPLDCVFCGKQFVDKEARWQHTVAAHLRTSSNSSAEGVIPDRFYPCPICGQAVLEHWTLEQHLEFLKPLIGLAAQCLICKKTFGELRAVNQHMRICRIKSTIPNTVVTKEAAIFQGANVPSTAVNCSEPAASLFDIEPLMHCIKGFARQETLEDQCCQRPANSTDQHQVPGVA